MAISIAEKNFEKKFSKDLLQKIEGITPGVVVQAYQNGQKKIDIEVGETYPYYDWASLTKVVFGTTMAMHAYDENQNLLEEKALRYLKWFMQPSVDIRSLLTHTSGLTWWKPLYVNMDISKPREERWEDIKKLIAAEPLDLKPVAVYSDLNFILLGCILEEFFEKRLLDIFEMVKENFSLKKTCFHVDNKPMFEVEKYAPTEECLWRKKRLQGEVHDENCWALGGVSTHSGLFGPIEDLSKWILKLRQVLVEVQTDFFISSNTIQEFIRRAISQNVGDFSLGFMMKAAKDSTCGQFFSKNSVGHTGFTGTSVWWDPDQDLIITVLSNRVYYGREKQREFKEIRQFIHDEIYKGLVK